MVIGSQSQPSRPDPVIYISGGPGSPLTIYADPQARKPYAPGRDLILVDQRGTGRSEPSLCPALEPMFAQVPMQPPSAEVWPPPSPGVGGFFLPGSLLRGAPLDPSELLLHPEAKPVAMPLKQSSAPKTRIAADLIGHL